MRSRLAIGALLAILAVAPLAHAAGFRAEDPDAKKEYLEKIAKGEAAFAAHDMPGAEAAFQDAVHNDPARMLAPYRMGELYMSMGKHEEALTTLRNALGKKSTPALKSKVMYLIGLVCERAHKLPEAKESFANYIAFVQTNAEIKGFPKIAAQHIKVIERRMKDEVDYGAVKDRIQKREKEKEAEAAENAKNR